MEEKIGGGGGERRCAGMGGEPTDSDTEGTVADSMEAKGGEAAEEEPVPTGCCRWRWRWCCRSLPLTLGGGAMHLCKLLWEKRSAR